MPEEVRGPGTVQSRTSVKVGSRITGTVMETLVDVGDRVERGQLLATLDDAALEPRASAAAASVGAAKLKVARARAARAKAEASLDLARENHRRHNELHAQGSVPKSVLDDSAAALRIAEAAALEANLEIEQLNAEASRTQREWGASKADASFTRVTSPMRGLVVERYVEPGSQVVPATALFHVIDERALWVAVMVDESLVRKIRVGSAASVRLRSGAVVPGKVARITLVADVVTRELEVDVAVDLSDKEFAINEEADATIFGDEKRGVLVPAGAIVEDPKEPSKRARGVLTARQGRAAFVPVEEVLSTATSSLVLGLNPGEQVILEPLAIREGRRVEPLLANVP